MRSCVRRSLGAPKTAPKEDVGRAEVVGEYKYDREVAEDSGSALSAKHGQLN